MNRIEWKKTVFSGFSRVLSSQSAPYSRTIHKSGVRQFHGVGVKNKAANEPLRYERAWRIKAAKQSLTLSLAKALSITICLFTAASYLSPTVAYAGAGTDSAAFLKVDAGARASALSGTFAAIADDASSVFYNPAGPALTVKKEIMLSHNEWFEGLRNEHAAFVCPLSGRLTLFAGLNIMTMPALTRYDVYGGEAGSFSAMDGAALSGMSWALSRDTFIGAAVKGIYQQADRESAFAFAGDFGVIHNYKKFLRLGLSIQNLGTPLSLYHQSFALPLSYTFAGAYRLMDMIWFTAQARKAGASELGFSAGAEGQYPVTKTEIAFARLGYKTAQSRNTGPGITAGLGLETSELRFDYAFSPLGDLGAAHRISVSFKFGEERDEFKDIERAREFARPAKRGRTYTRYTEQNSEDAQQDQQADRPKPVKEKKKVQKKETKKYEPMYLLW